jgi:collagenase-like PrtC family protease
MPKLKIKGKTKKFKYTKEGVASYKKQLAKSKKMPKSVGNDSDESLDRVFSMEKGNYTHYAPKIEKNFLDPDGGGVSTQRNQTNKAQEKQRKKRREKTKLTSSKPQKGY